MNACRAALLLATLTCSAQAAELVSFSRDHVTIKAPIPDSGELSDKEIDDATKLALKTCGAYSKAKYHYIEIDGVKVPSSYPQLVQGKRQDDGFYVWHWACKY